MREPDSHVSKAAMDEPKSTQERWAKARGAVKAVAAATTPFATDWMLSTAAEMKTKMGSENCV